MWVFEVLAFPLPTCIAIFRFYTSLEVMQMQPADIKWNSIIKGQLCSNMVYEKEKSFILSLSDCSVELDFKQQEDKLQPLMKRLCPADSIHLPQLPYPQEAFTSTPKRKSKAESKKHARWKLWFLWGPPNHPYQSSGWFIYGLLVCLASSFQLNPPWLGFPFWMLDPTWWVLLMLECRSPSFQLPTMDLGEKKNQPISSKRSVKAHTRGNVEIIKNERRFIFLKEGICEGTERHVSFFRGATTSWRGWPISSGAPGATTSAYHCTGKHNKKLTGTCCPDYHKTRKKYYTIFKHSDSASRQTEYFDQELGRR